MRVMTSLSWLDGVDRRWTCGRPQADQGRLHTGLAFSGGVGVHDAVLALPPRCGCEGVCHALSGARRLGMCSCARVWYVSWGCELVQGSATSAGCSEGQCGGRQGRGSTQHFPPRFGKGEGNVRAHTLRQRGRVGTCSHGQGLGKPSAHLAGRRAEAPGGVDPKGAKIPSRRLARAPALHVLCTTSKKKRGDISRG